jgi:hypothetical protein
LAAAAVAVARVQADAAMLDECRRGAVEQLDASADVGPDLDAVPHLSDAVSRALRPLEFPPY